MKNYCLVITLFSALVSNVYADDTEIFVDSPSGRAQVLIVFDTSGSMSSLTLPEREAFDPTITYPQQGNIQSDRIYWSTSTDYPGTNSSNWMAANRNNCQDSLTPLEVTGKYLGNLVQFKEFTERVRVRRRLRRIDVERKEWLSFDRDDHNNYYDCQQDYDNADNRNPGDGYPNGYPLNDVAGGNTTNINESNASWRGPYTLFSANFLNWYHNPDLVETARSRIVVAKEVISSLVRENTSIDFGLDVFNSDGRGGRIVKKIELMDNDARELFVTENIDPLIASGSTPLCESTYEAYRYLTGLGLHWGDSLSSPTPPRDTTAESGGAYIAPELTCGDQLYIILMTDGVPTNDTGSNSQIKQLTNKKCQKYPSSNGKFTENCLPQLAEYIANLGGLTGYTGTPVKTYTIGFNLDEDQILLDTATLGGGQAYSANTADELTRAFEGVFIDILASASRFTAPTIATNAFSRVRSIDDAYIAAFVPRSTPRWPGNLKKLRIGAGTVLLDQSELPAIDPGTGQIRDTARTFWSDVVDGGDVELGGAGGELISRAISDRTIYTNTGVTTILEDFDTDNEELTEVMFGIEEDDDLEEIINWTIGWDVRDEDDDDELEEARPWILGDILHSRPLAINYGAINGHTTDDPDIRLVFGTNAGFLHMVSSDTGREDWAFFPKELADIAVILYDNNSLNEHPYGVDGQVSVYLEDSNFDGSITSNERAIVMFGLRRGGLNYYAMDVTNPDSPVMMWTISNILPGFSQMAQTWSRPQLVRLAGYDNPVAIFGAGYDENKDLTDSAGIPVIGSTDTKGRGVFIVDLITGALVQSFTSEADSALNTHVDIDDSIPATLKTIDSNGDGFVDRAYASDTGGNIWRIDMPGQALPLANRKWSMFKFAELGGTTAATDRRFFNQPDVLQTIFRGASYDAVVIGSGDRPHPNESGADNMFFMLKDFQIFTSCHSNDKDLTGCSTPIPAAITVSDLFDATDDTIGVGSAGDRNTALSNLAATSGWRIDLAGAGEKNLGAASTAGGLVVFTSYTPGGMDDSSGQVCSIASGRQLVYAINLHDATPRIFGTDSSSRSKTLLGSGIFGEAGTYYGEDGITQIIGLLREDHIDTGFSLQSYRTFWYEQQKE